VSRTRTGSNQIKNTVLEVVKKDDGIFDLFLNRKLDRNDIPETWLPERLCVRFGFCGEEYDSIPREVNQNGRATVVFGWLIEKIALTSVILTEYKWPDNVSYYFSHRQHKRVRTVSRLEVRVAGPSPIPAVCAHPLP
jgi:hypothetical protein